MVKIIYICDLCKMELFDNSLKQRIFFKIYDEGNIIDYNYVFCNKCLKKIVEFVENKGVKK